VQLYVLNNQGQKIDSLINTNTLIEAGIPINEVVKTPTLSVLKIQLTEKLISELKLSNKLLIKLKVNSNSNMVYKLYNHYNIDLKIVGDLEYEI
jgi:hypothetical protein